jgi:hypothetical protein
MISERCPIIIDLVRPSRRTASRDASRSTLPALPQGELYDYHGRLEEKYAMAASRPWLSVEPDPPEPKRIPLGGSGDP